MGNIASPLQRPGCTTFAEIIVVILVIQESRSPVRDRTDLILPPALRPVVYSVFNRKEYRTQTNKLRGP
jgi:hypothetical protein